jgi:hypothetical protein
MRCSRDRRAISLIRLTRCGHPKRGILGAPNQSLATMSAIGIFGQLVHSWRRLIPGLLTSHYRTLAEHGFRLAVIHPESARKQPWSNFPRCGSGLRPRQFLLNILCSLCVTSARIPATRHIIVAAPDGSGAF